MSGSTSGRSSSLSLQPSQTVSFKVCIDFFVAVNIYHHQHFSFDECIQNIASAVKTGEATYFLNHEGSYYDDILSVWKNMTVIKLL